MTPQTVEKKPTGIAPPQSLVLGTILTLRMQGHTRTNGQEYFAPAIVLDQYDDMFGSIEALVFDVTAGTHYQHSYPIRDISTRGPDNELYETRSNVGEILFSPGEFSRLVTDVESLIQRVMRLESVAPRAAAQPLPPPVKVTHNEPDKPVR